MVQLILAIFIAIHGGAFPWPSGKIGAIPGHTKKVRGRTDGTAGALISVVVGGDDAGVTVCRSVAIGRASEFNFKALWGIVHATSR
jgi:hypothetical protein